MFPYTTGAERRGYVLANGEDSLDGNVHDHHALSTEVERQNLKSVGNEETGETNGVEDTEEPDEGQLGIAGTLVGDLDTVGELLRDGNLDLRVLVDGTGDGPEGEGGDHAAGGGEEERATTEAINAEGSSNRDGEIEDGLASGQGELLVLLGDTRTLVDDVHVVGEEGVTRVLRDDTEGDDDGQTPQVALGPEEVEVRGGAVAVAVGLDGLLDLAVLELDEGVVLVAATVVLGQHGKSLLRLVLVDEETRGLGDPPDTDELHHGGDGLDEGDGPPGPVAADGGGSPADAGHDEGAQVPETVVDGGQGTTVLGVADLGQQHGRTHLREGVAETEDEAAAHVHVVAGGEGSEHGTDDHESAADHDGGLTADPVRNEGGDQEGDDGTDVVHVDEDAELVRVLVLGEEVLPVVHLLGGVEEHAIVTSGRRTDEQEDGQEVEVAQMRLLVPGNLLELGSLLAGSVQLVSRRGLHEVLADVDHFGGLASEDGITSDIKRGY